MAAPSLDVDWDAVRAHAITHGVRNAARAFGINEDSTCARSAREGWLLAIREIVANPSVLLPASQKPIESNASKPSVAARNSLADIGNKSRLNLARAVRKGSIKAARMDGAEILAKADKLKALASTGDVVFGWSSAAQSPTLRLELIAGAVGMLSQEELPAIDVEAEVTPKDQTEK